MTIEEIEADLAAAIEERDRLQGELGDMLLSDSGDKGAAVTRKLQKAQAKVEETERKVAALIAAQEAAKRAAVEREERQAQEALERLLREAQADHGELMRKAAAADAAFDDFNQALSDLAGACDDFVDRYRELNFQRNEVAVLRLRGWNGQILANLKNHGERSFRNFLQQQNIKPTGSGKKVTISQRMPEFSRLLTGREPAKRRTETVNAA